MLEMHKTSTSEITSQSKNQSDEQPLYFSMKTSLFFQQINCDDGEEDEEEDDDAISDESSGSSFSEESDDEIIFSNYLDHTPMDIDENAIDSAMADDVDDDDIFGLDLFEEMETEENEMDNLGGVFFNLYSFNNAVVSINNNEYKKTLSRTTIKASRKWNRYYSNQPGTMKLPSRVSFATNNVIHHLDDLLEDRRSDWLKYAIDRERFKARIASTEDMLASVLDSEHRQKIHARIFKE